MTFNSFLSHLDPKTTDPDEGSEEGFEPVTPLSWPSSPLHVRDFWTSKGPRRSYSREVPLGVLNFTTRSTFGRPPPHSLRRRDHRTASPEHSSLSDGVIDHSIVPRNPLLYRYVPNYSRGKVVLVSPGPVVWKTDCLGHGYVSPVYRLWSSFILTPSRPLIQIKVTWGTKCVDI